MTDLFGDLPSFPPALPADELCLLSRLPDWDTTQEIEDHEEAAARRLERRGLIKIERHKDDPCAIRPRMWAGRLTTSHLRAVERQ